MTDGSDGTHTRKRVPFRLLRGEVIPSCTRRDDPPGCFGRAGGEGPREGLEPTG